MNKQEKIDYIDVIDLGFEEEIFDDCVFFNTYGFQYKIVTKQLTKKIYIDWYSVERTCKLVRVDSPKTGNIIAEMKLLNLEQVKQIIDFYE